MLEYDGMLNKNETSKFLDITNYMFYYMFSLECNFFTKPVSLPCNGSHCEALRELMKQFSLMSHFNELYFDVR